MIARQQFICSAFWYDELQTSFARLTYSVSTTCDVIDADDCRDLQPVRANCEYWAAIGEGTDVSSSRYMTGSCAKTCGMCVPQTSDTTPTPQGTD